MTDSMFSKDYEYLRELLVAARTSQGLTQVDVAKRLGKPQSFVSKYERGERRLDVIEFLQVAGVLEIDPADVIAQLERYQKAEEPLPSNILETWRITSRDLTVLLEQNPSLRGMLLGYVAELKFQTLWLTSPEISESVKDDDYASTMRRAATSARKAGSLFWTMSHTSSSEIAS